MSRKILPSIKDTKSGALDSSPCRLTNRCSGRRNNGTWYAPPAAELSRQATAHAGAGYAD